MEYLDEVRFFANGSSGRMGYALAEAAIARGDEVHLVTGPTALAEPAGAHTTPVVSALEMEAAVDRVLDAHLIDTVIAVAAVADYRPAERHAGKLPSGVEEFAVPMVRNPDILAGLGRRRAAGDLRVQLVGFALQAGSASERVALGRKKLHAKNLDLIVVNHVTAMGAADNEVTLVFADGREQLLPRQSKPALATAILAAAAAQDVDFKRHGNTD